MARIRCEIEVCTERTGPDRLSMRISQRLPAVCPRHGGPAIEYRPGSVRFHRSGQVHVQSTFSSTFRWWLRRLSRTPPATTIELFARWPVCARCTRQRRYLHLLAVGLVLAGLVPVLVLLVGGYLQILTPPQSPMLALIFIPIWFPGAIAVAGSAYARASRYARIVPITDENRIVIRAHPHFAENATG